MAGADGVRGAHAHAALPTTRRLKLTTGRTIQVMNGLKSKLNKLMAQQDFLRKEIKDRGETAKAARVSRGTNDSSCKLRMV